MRTFLIIILTVFSLKAKSQVAVTQILAYEYNNEKNTFTSNVVGKESFDIDGSGNQTLVVVKLTRNPGAEYQYIERIVKVIAMMDIDGKTEIREEKEIIVPYVDETFYVPVLISQGSTELSIKVELYEKGKLVSTKKQLLATWSGD